MKMAKRYGSSVILLMLLGLFIYGFAMIKNIYALNHSTASTIVLSDNLFNKKAFSGFDFLIKAVTRVDTPNNLTESVVLDNHTLAYITAPNSKKPTSHGLYLMDTVSSSLVQLDSRSCRHIFEIDSGKKLIYDVLVSPKGIYKTFLYDLAIKKTIREYDGTIYQAFPSGSKYLDISGGKLFLQDMENGSRRMIVKISRAAAPELSGTGSISISMPLPLSPKNRLALGLRSIRIATNSRTLYYISGYEDHGGLYELGLDFEYRKEASPNPLILGAINAYTVLKGGNLLFSGNVKGENGLFYYSAKNKKSKLLVRGNISGLDLTPGGRFAYISNNNRGTNELHAAYFNNGALHYDNVIYKNLDNVKLLKWTKDGKYLFCVINNLSGSSIFRFAL